MKEKKMKKAIISVAFGLAIMILAIPAQANAAVKPKILSVSAKSKTMYVGQKYRLKVKSVSPASADKLVTWKSSYARCASVNQSGVVTAKRSGNIKITATSKSKKTVKAVCKIRIKYGVKNKSMKINKSSAVVYEGKKIKLSVNKWSPSNTTVKTLSWSSSNSYVATVSSTGKVSGKNAGIAKITATNTYGKMVSCNVSVKYIVATKVTVSCSTIRLCKDDTFGGLKPVVYPSNAKYRNVTYRSVNPLVATVDEVGKIKAVGRGNTTIEIVSHDGKVARVSVTVVEQDWVAMSQTESESQYQFKLSSTRIPKMQICWNENTPYTIEVSAIEEYLKKQDPTTQDLTDAGWTTIDLTTEPGYAVFMKDNGTDKPSYSLKVKLAEGNPEEYTLLLDKTVANLFQMKPYEYTYTSVVTE